MKKLLKLIAVSALSFSLLGGVAAAATTCNISNGNGTGSNNTCTISENFNVSVTCSNGINASFNNSQAATSGNASANGNTIVGNVSSGSAENAASFATELSAFCVAAAPTPAPTPTPTPTPTPSKPQVQGQSTTKVAALPKTGETSLLSGTVAVTAAAAVAAILSKLTILAYAKIRK